MHEEIQTMDEDDMGNVTAKEKDFVMVTSKKDKKKPRDIIMRQQLL